jgi:hypothetical protein
MNSFLVVAADLEIVQNDLQCMIAIAKFISIGYLREYPTGEGTN